MIIESVANSLLAGIVLVLLAICALRVLYWVRRLVLLSLIGFCTVALFLVRALAFILGRRDPYPYNRP